MIERLKLLLFREIPPVTRPCQLCGSEIAMVEDGDGNKVALDAKPAGETYIMPVTIRLPGQRNVARVLKQIYYTSHAHTCEVKRQREERIWSA